MTTAGNYKIHLPKFHSKQAAFAESPAKRKVIVAGRRGGKTTGVGRVATESAIRGRRVLEAAPTADQTNTFRANCKRFLREPIAAGAVYVNNTDRVIEMPNGGRIRTKTAWNADTLRGDYADLLILDEFSLMDETAWSEVGAPMLLDNNGDAIFIFTPKRKNHAFNLYQRAVADDTGRWGAWHFTSYDNPFLNEAALAEITADMTDSAYRQEIMAEFLESEGQVFRNIPACLRAPETTPDNHRGHRIVAGIDWGKLADYTAISLVCADCFAEVARDRFNQIDYHVQRQRLSVLCERWNVSGILAESNSMGEPVIEELQREGLPVWPFQTTSTSKPPLIESLALAFEKQECQWQNDPVWIGELEAYEMKTSATTGRPSYSAPDGLHDDTVMARALAWKAVTDGINAEVEVFNLGQYMAQR